MSFETISTKKLALIMIGIGVVAISIISGFQARDVLFAQNITEETRVIIKTEQGTCILQASDNVPREIPNCSYSLGDLVSITYKREQPAVISHEPAGQD